MTTCGQLRTRLSIGIATLAVAATVATLPLAGPAHGQSPPGPNLNGLPSRIVSLQPRVLSLKPRVVSVAPRHTSANSFTVNSDVLFAFDSSVLSPDTQAVLVSVVQALQGAPNGTVAIVGYTDSIGSPAYNIGLSQRRAASVQAYLAAHVARPGLKYTSRGLGEADPVAPNTLPNGQDNPSGRQQNRRVTITFAPA